jgi:hypothetical protein
MLLLFRKIVRIFSTLLKFNIEMLVRLVYHISHDKLLPKVAFDSIHLITSVIQHRIRRGENRISKAKLKSFEANGHIIWN